MLLMGYMLRKIMANKNLRFIKVYRIRCSRKSEASAKTSSGDDCRVCRKSFGPEEVSRTCCECQHKVCEDCASYSTTTNSDDPVSLPPFLINLLVRCFSPVNIAVKRDWTAFGRKLITELNERKTQKDNAEPNQMKI